LTRAWRGIDFARYPDYRLIAGPVDDLIAESQENPRVKNLLSITKRNVQRLRGLVDQLMDFSRLEGGKYAMTARPIPIGSYTRDLANLFRSAVERSKLDFIVDCDDDLGRRCYVDPGTYCLFRSQGSKVDKLGHDRHVRKGRYEPSRQCFEVLPPGFHTC
jgi:signal transduction histidine kinase